MSSDRYEPGARDSVEHWILLNKVDRENPRPGEQWLAVHYVDDVDALSAENDRLRRLLSQVFSDPTIALSFGIVHRDAGWDDDGNPTGTGEITHVEPEGSWRREVRELLNTTQPQDASAR